MSRSNKGDILRYDQRVIGAKQIGRVLDGQHPVIGELTGRIRHLADNPLTVVVMGEFSAGKSSFLNRLLGSDALPVAILPKTATLTRLVHGGPEAAGRVEIDRQVGDGYETQVISREAFTDLQRAAKVHDIGVARDLARIREVRVFLDDPLLTKLQLVDTPGFNHDQDMDDRTLGILAGADIVLWITDAVQPAKLTEVEKLRLLKGQGKRIWLIVNKADVNVTDGAAWEEARQSLAAYFEETGFLAFFESRTVELISCRQTEDFWTGKFEQTKARLGAEVFSDDIKWASRLIADEWQRLGEALADEAGRYQELGRHCEALHALTRVKALADHCQAALDAALEPLIEALDEALLAHAETGRQTAAQGIESVTSFVMDYTRGPLVQAFRDLARTYDEFLTDWQVQHLTGSIVLLDAIQRTLPREHAALRAEAVALRDYANLRRARLFEPGYRISGYCLPALSRTADMLDHLYVQFAPFKWSFSMDIEQDGVLPVGTLGTDLTPYLYRHLQINTALARDFRCDLERLVRDPAVLGLLAQLKALCHGTGERLAAAQQHWNEHAICPDAD
jgi:ribosome biogenesis GTPase A